MLYCINTKENTEFQVCTKRYVESLIAYFSPYDINFSFSR